MPFRFFSPPTLNSLTAKKDIQGLTAWMQRTFPTTESRDALAALVSLGWQPGMDEAGAMAAIFQNDFERVVAIGTPAVEPLVRLLQDPRIQAQSFRPVYGTSESGELSGVNYETVNSIRKQAREALERMGSLAVPPLVAILSREGEALGAALEPVLYILTYSGDPRAMEGFLAVLQRNPRSFTFWDRFQFAIRRQPDRRVIPHLRRTLAGGGLDSMVRGIITQILQELGEPAGK